ncbi:MAG: SLBB domain-containing protein, partial [Candidatus Krumholzibacteriota bacterium]|nr:SLBB domain-containing protein [Candidatus Krumholzibacteriota bacterium]
MTLPILLAGLIGSGAVSPHSIYAANQTSGEGADSPPPAPKQATPEQIEKAKEFLQQDPGETAKETPAVSSDAAPPASREQELSAMEAYMRGKASSTVSTRIRQFGYDLFGRPPSTFAPVDAVPVGPNYLLGPGDEIRITLWGKVNADYTIVIDREGKIAFPQIGLFQLSGMTFAEAKAYLRRELSRHYQPSQVKMNVAMGRLRTIGVFVVGKARRPGTYTLSSLSTLVNGLFATGGPAKVGSMRDIQLKRNGETIVHFDMYDFLLEGDKTSDVRLMPEDVIFIPPVGPLVGIAGNVKSPAIYELKGETRLRDLMKMAGGVSATGYLQRIQLERIFQNEAKIILDFDLTELPGKGDLLLRDGDVVKVFPIIEAVVNRIELGGNILRPGTYEWREGIRIRDLITSPDDLLPDTFLDFALVERLVPPDMHKEYLSFGLGRLLIEGADDENIALERYDKIVVFYKWDLVERENVRIAGAVNKPGTYEYRTNMKLSDLLKLAGGFKRYAFTERAELTRVTPTPIGPKVVTRFVHPGGALSGDPQHDIALEENDYLFVRAVPEWELYRTVSILGEVKFPGTYTTQKGQTLSSLIERAGGYTDRAYLKGAVFSRQSVMASQRALLDESIDRLEQQVLSQSAATIEGASTPEAVEQQQAALEGRRALIARMRATKPKGSISIRLDELQRFRGSPSDIPLEEGDKLFIPEQPRHIQVI